MHLLNTSGVTLQQPTQSNHDCRPGINPARKAHPRFRGSKVTDRTEISQISSLPALLVSKTRPPNSLPVEPIYIRSRTSSFYLRGQRSRIQRNRNIPRYNCTRRLFPCGELKLAFGERLEQGKDISASPSKQTDLALGSSWKGCPYCILFSAAARTSRPHHILLRVLDRYPKFKTRAHSGRRQTLYDYTVRYHTRTCESDIDCFEICALDDCRIEVYTHQ